MNKKEKYGTLDWFLHVVMMSLLSVIATLFSDPVAYDADYQLRGKRKAVDMMYRSMDHKFGDGTTYLLMYVSAVILILYFIHKNIQTKPTWVSMRDKIQDIVSAVFFSITAVCILYFGHTITEFTEQTNVIFKWLHIIHIQWILALFYAISAIWYIFQSIQKWSVENEN